MHLFLLLVDVTKSVNFVFASIFWLCISISFNSLLIFFFLLRLRKNWIDFIFKFKGLLFNWEWNWVRLQIFACQKSKCFFIFCFLFLYLVFFIFIIYNFFFLIFTVIITFVKKKHSYLFTFQPLVCYIMYNNMNEMGFIECGNIFISSMT